MGKAHSLDLPEKVVAAVKAGAPQKQAAELLRRLGTKDHDFGGEGACGRRLLGH